MKKRLVATMALAALAAVQAVTAQQSQPIGRAAPLSAQEVQKGVDNGSFCTDAKGSAYSLGAVIRSAGKTYRCVKAYGGQLEAQTRLVWVELVEREASFSTAP